jgi:arylsulfatase
MSRATDFAKAHATLIGPCNEARRGLTKVGMPGADVGLRAEDPTIAELLKPLGPA